MDEMTLRTAAHRDLVKPRGLNKNILRLGRDHGVPAADDSGQTYEAIRFKVTKGSARRPQPGKPAAEPKWLAVPVLPELREILNAAPSGHLTYLVTEFGNPISVAGLGNWFRDPCNAAGLPHCSAHGIRKYGATHAAEAGATEHQLMGMFGWDDPKQAATYTRKARQQKLARASMHLLSSKQANKKAG